VNDDGLDGPKYNVHNGVSMSVMGSEPDELSCLMKTKAEVHDLRWRRTEVGLPSEQRTGYNSHTITRQHKIYRLTEKFCSAQSVSPFSLWLKTARN